ELEHAVLAAEPLGQRAHRLLAPAGQDRPHATAHGLLRHQHTREPVRPVDHPARRFLAHGAHRTPAAPDYLRGSRGSRRRRARDQEPLAGDSAKVAELSQRVSEPILRPSASTSGSRASRAQVVAAAAASSDGSSASDTLMYEWEKSSY